MNNNGNLFNQVVNDTQEPARSHAIAGLVLGIISLVLAAVNFFVPEISIAGGLIIGIIGICLASVAKKRGNTSAMCNAGLTLSIIGVVAHSLTFVGCFGLMGCMSCLLCAAL